MSFFFAHRSAVVVAVLALACAGCGGKSGSNAASPTKTVLVTQTVTVTSSPSAETTSPSATDTAPSDGDGEEGSGSPAPVSTGAPLTLANFFNPSDAWTENRYDEANVKGVQGIASQIEYCSADEGQSLELRLANAFSTLKFDVAQANDSNASDQQLIVEVVANGSQVDIQRVPFNQVQSFSVPVTGVNALVINIYLDSDVRNCGESGSVVAVLSNMVLS